MRARFGKLLADQMLRDEKLILLAGDVGFGVLDAAASAYPDRFFNMGAAEQAMIGAAVGLTYEGHRVICYTITPFMLYRPFEWLRNYLHIEKANVKLVGVGRGSDYGKLGYTHWCHEQKAVLASLPNIRTFFPQDTGEMETMWPTFLQDGPAYLNLVRG